MWLPSENLGPFGLLTFLIVVNDVKATSDEINSMIPETSSEFLCEKVNHLVDCASNVNGTNKDFCEKFVVQYEGTETLSDDQNRSLGLYQYVGNRKGKKGPVFVLSGSDFNSLIHNYENIGWRGVVYTETRVWEVLLAYAWLKGDGCRSENITECKELKMLTPDFKDEDANVECVIDVSYGEWENDGECQAFGIDKTCGPGTQLQARDCYPGTIEDCNPENMVQNITCEEAGTALPACTPIIPTTVTIEPETTGTTDITEIISTIGTIETEKTSEKVETTERLYTLATLYDFSAFFAANNGDPYERALRRYRCEDHGIDCDSSNHLGTNLWMPTACTIVLIIIQQLDME